jgi:predicted nucleic acid-binding protein
MLVAAHKVVGKKTHDARLVAAMNVHGVSHILTFNTGDFKRFVGIQTIHPDAKISN